MTDISELIDAKEKELNAAEEALTVIEDEIDLRRNKINVLKLQKDELEIQVKKLAQEFEPLRPQQRKGNRNCERMRRELRSLTRQYFKEERFKG